MHFIKAQTKYFWQHFFRIQGVQLNNLKPMKNCPGVGARYFKIDIGVPWLLSVHMRWFCCCSSIVYCCRGSVFSFSFYAVLSVFSSFAVILMRKRELLLLLLYSAGLFSVGALGERVSSLCC